MIYVLQGLEGGPVKIGCTDHLDTRIKQLEAHYRRPLALLATMEGGRDEERAIHERFAAHRLGKTEQFRPVAEIMAFIGRPLLVGAAPDAVEVMPDRSGAFVRLTIEALDAARIAASFRGFNLSEYASEALLEIANRDIERGYQARTQGAAKKKGSR